MALSTRLNTDKAFDIANCTILSIVLLIVLYPLYFILIASISDPNFVNLGRVVLWPRGITLDGYRRIFTDSQLWASYRNTILYTSTGTAINLALTTTAGYALSRKDLVGRNLVMGLLVFTMLFSGGLIPRYLLVRNLGLLNSIWAIILPHAVIVWNLIITRTFFQSTIPKELFEAALMDGCSNANFFAKVVLPLSPAILAVLVLFYGVFHWNAFFDALIFISNRDLHPLQLILRDILISASQLQGMEMGFDASADEQMMIAETIKYGVIIVASVPILVLYPFLQKYFVKGVMIGAIKG